MLLGLHLRSMASMPLWFWRVRRLEQIIKAQPGALKTHRYISRRSLLLLIWWRDHETAQGWLSHPAYRRVETQVKNHHIASFWVELYQLKSQAASYDQGGAPNV